jgi:hypothetical protein
MVLFRWTCGNTTVAGLETLARSVKLAKKAFDGYPVEYAVCYNNLTELQVEQLQKLDVPLVRQEPTHLLRPYLDAGTDQRNRHKTGGSLWKICPPRLAPDKHEIVCDNDVLIHSIDQIKPFLDGDCTMFARTGVRYYGTYAHLISEGAYNSGLIGMPPGFDFQKEIVDIIYDNPVAKFTYGEEQALVIAALLKYPRHVVLEVRDMYELKTDLDGFTDIIHFIGVNRADRHYGWEAYKQRSV